MALKTTAFVRRLLVNVRPNILAACGLLVALAAPTLAWPGTIQLKTQAQVGTTVRLQDIATLEGPDAMALGRLVISERRGTSATEKQTVTVQALRRMLTQQGHNLAGLRFQGPLQCTLTPAPAPGSAPGTSGSEANENTGNLAAQAWASPAVVSAAPVGNPLPTTQPAHPARWTVADVMADIAAQALGTTRTEVRVVAQNPQGLTHTLLQQPVANPQALRVVWTGDKQPGPTRLHLEKRDASGQTIEQLALDVIVEQQATVLVANNALQTGDRLSTRDYTAARRWVNQPQDQWLQPDGPWQRDRLVAPVAKGQAIPAQAMPAPLVIRRGQTVSVYTEVGGMRLLIQARAQAEGRVGQTIAFQNPKTRAVLMGTVQANGTARIGNPS